MKREELLKKIAPCSLMCHTCVAYEDGVISKTAGELLQRLEGLKEFYEKYRKDQVEPYGIFYDQLKGFSNGSCSGCRGKENCCCSIEGCFILECTQDHNVDYCGECDEFPCDKTKELFEPIVYKQWLEGNASIKKFGIDEFWKQNSEKPHLLPYIDK